MRNQEVIYNLLGQSFFYDPPEGQPTGTPTLTVYLATNDDDQTGESAAGACTVDTVSTTLATAAVAGDETLTVGSGTGIARTRRYLLTSVDGHREWIDCTAITGTTVTLRRPLVNSYAVTTSTFKGCRISAAVDSTWVATKSKITDVLGATWNTALPVNLDISPGAAGYRLRWAYTVGGVATIGVSYADLVRYQAKNLVSPLDVENRFPGFIDRLATDYVVDQGQALVDEAFCSLKMDAMADAQLLRRVRNTEVLRELVIYRANLSAKENAVLSGGDVNALQALELAQKLYAQRYDQLLREPKVPVDQTGSGASAEAVRLPVWRR